MAVGYDAVSNSGYEASLSTYNWNHTVSGSNRLLLVGVAIFASGSVTSITLGAQSFTFIRSDTDGVYRSEIWKLVAPNTGAGTITVNLSASLTSVGGAVSYTGVDQTTPTEADNGAHPAAGVNITTVADNDWVFSAIATDCTSISANETSRVNSGGLLGTLGLSDVGPKTPAGVQTISWNESVCPDLLFHATSGVAIRAAAAEAARRRAFTAIM